MSDYDINRFTGEFDIAGMSKEELDALYEPVLPSTPENPDSKFLNGNRQWARVGLVGRVPTKAVIDGDLYAMYLVSATKKIQIPDLGYGYDITSIVVQCASADPTTELNANIMKCDAQGTGAFPGANPTLVKAIDTTTGNFTWTGTETVATGKELYLLMDANVDYGVMWTITITYTLKTS